MLRSLLFASVVIALMFAGWLLLPPATTFDAASPVPAEDNALATRGEYLAIAGNCASCHTAPGGEQMAGGLPFVTPFGTIHSTNITPDAETGIGNWSFADFANSMRHGVRPDGTQLYPVFPYTAFTRISDDDLAAIFAYLNSLPAIRQPTPANDLSFPFNIRALMKAWKALFFEYGVYEPDATQSDEWNRGAYLVQALAHCGECHTPRNALGAARAGSPMAGGEYLDRVPGGGHRPWFAPDLTSSDTGLALWPEGELAAYLKTGRNFFIETFGPMNEVIMNSTSRLGEDDIRAMTVYLKELSGSAQAVRAPVPERIMGRGRTIYNLHCGTCHLPTGEGDPDMAPKLNRGSLVVQAVNPASMINAILYSPEGPDLPPRWRERMDEFQYILDDEEVAAVASYIRNSWGNRAGLVTPDQVARQR
ncbi:MAG: cytochrome c [Gammaproteobacteria bacterium]|nr:cytochrome c [Gammaproteobacteria bacterium]MDH5311699.1 cytochrome c [Gammaproteobacteria bacterium]